MRAVLPRAPPIIGRTDTTAGVYDHGYGSDARAPGIGYLTLITAIGTGSAIVSGRSRSCERSR